MHRTVTLDQASRQVDTYMDHARAAISPRATLVDSNSPPGRAGAFNPDTLQCEDEESGEPIGTYNVGKQRQLNGVDPEKLPEAFSAFRGWVAKNGFTITSDNENSREHPSMIARNNQGYGVTLDSVNGMMYLTGSSPCVWRNGIPPSGS